MSIFESIVNQFNEHIEITSKCIELSTPGIAEATHLFTETILADKKVLCCTSSDTFSCGWQFAQNLIYSSELQRPSLPVIFLNSIINNLVTNKPHSDPYLHLVQTLGNKDDVLFVISCNSNDIILKDLILAAHEKLMPVIALLPDKNDGISSALNTSDVIIKVNALNSSQILAMQFLVCIYLSELIEKQLFGHSL